MIRINTTDREIAEFEDGGQKQVGKRKMDRGARITNLAVRYAEHHDAGRFPRGVAWNYIWKMKQELVVYV